MIIIIKKCPYEKCKLGCHNINSHKAIYGKMNSKKKEIKKSNKINYEVLEKINKCNYINLY